MALNFVIIPFVLSVYVTTHRNGIKYGNNSYFPFFSTSFLRALVRASLKIIDRMTLANEYKQKDVRGSGVGNLAIHKSRDSKLESYTCYRRSVLISLQIKFVHAGRTGRRGRWKVQLERYGESPNVALFFLNSLESRRTQASIVPVLVVYKFLVSLL